MFPNAAKSVKPPTHILGTTPYWVVNFLSMVASRWLRLCISRPTWRFEQWVFCYVRNCFAMYSVWIIEGSKLWSPFAVSWELSEMMGSLQWCRFLGTNSRLLASRAGLTGSQEPYRSINLARIWTHLGNKPLWVYMRELVDRVSWGGHP